MTRPQTLGELRDSGWRPRSVKHELRENVIARLRDGRPVFDGLIGYDRTVVPQVVDALLAGHDFILLGLRGQAKTRLLRSLAGLLDDALPVIAGSELNECPFEPITTTSRARVEAEGDGLPIVWLPREERYREKLATPDVTIADLLGDLDPIKAANERVGFSHEAAIHYGIVPRTNRGIFAVNELPDLAARIQVGLLNLLEEGDIQIRGFPLRLPLDMLLVFSANPEDYTNRGSIITPLRDRIASQILTHYPRTLDDALAITGQEAWVQRDGTVEVVVPDLLRRLVERVAFEARASDFVDQASGVSARMTIALVECVVSAAERRGLVTGEDRVVARVADVLASGAAITGKIELVYEGEREGPQAVAAHLIGKAVKALGDDVLPDALAPSAPGEGPVHDPVFEPVLKHFQQGGTVDVGDEVSAEAMRARLDVVPGLAELAAGFDPADEAERTAVMEFVLEVLHQTSLLSRDELVDGRVYKDPFDDMAARLRDE
jgi:magnesium chelatase subunit I